MLSGFSAQTRSEGNAFILDGGCLLEYLLCFSMFCFTEKEKTMRTGVGQAPEGLAGQKQQTMQEGGEGGVGGVPSGNLHSCWAGGGRPGQAEGRRGGWCRVQGQGQTG